MLHYAVVIGNHYLNNRRTLVFDTIEDCQRAVREYSRNVSGIYEYGYDDEGDVYELDDEECTMIRIGRISYNGRFHREIDDDEEVVIV